MAMQHANTQLAPLTLAGLLVLGCSDATRADGDAGSTETSSAATTRGDDATQSDSATQGDNTTDTTGGTTGDTDPSGVSAFNHAVDGIGGVQALDELEFLRIDATGTRKIDYEAFEPGLTTEVSEYTKSYSFDLENRGLRVDTDRTLLFEILQFFPPENFFVVLNGDVGGLDTQAGFAPAGNVPPQRVAALRVQQRLFNPHFYLIEGLADPSLVSDGGAEDFEGRPHQTFIFAGQVSDIRLFVDEETGSISKLETLENHVLVRDHDVQVRYYDWQARSDISFPSRVELYAGGAVLQDETRVQIEPDAVFPDDHFDLPAAADAPSLDSDAFAFGQQTHQVVEAFFSLAFYYNETTPVMSSQLAPGVTLLSAGLYNSLAVSYDKGVVVLEAPQSPAHGSLLVEAVAAAFPGQTITHVVQSHHHQDHCAGLRSLVAAGATAIVGDGSSGFWTDVLGAESTIRPDALAGAPIAASLEELPVDGSFTIADNNISIRAQHISDNPHSRDMIITIIEANDEVIVYEGDLYNAAFGTTLVLGGPESFFAALRDLDIIDANCESQLPLTIVPTHGAPQSLQDSLGELANLGVDVGCPKIPA